MEYGRSSERGTADERTGRGFSTGSGEERNDDDEDDYNARVGGSGIFSYTGKLGRET